MIGIVTLHIYFDVAQEKQDEFVSLYWDKYVPAIRIQEGFIQTTLFRSLENQDKFEIDIYFTSEPLRQKWANGPEHQETWPLIEAVVRKITWHGYEKIVQN